MTLIDGAVSTDTMMYNETNDEAMLLKKRWALQLHLR